MRAVGTLRVKFIPAFATALLLQALPLVAAEHEFVFAAGAWNASEWVMVKTPRLAYKGSWQQAQDHINNELPTTATESESKAMRKGEGYTSMLWKQKIADAKQVEISATMSFDERMAPLLVIASEIGEDATGYPEYREHWEVVLYDKGINIWHHTFKEGKQSWYKAASILQEFPAGEKIELKVTIKLGGRVPVMEARAGAHNLSYAELQLPQSFYVGLTACEGVNRFYDFKVKY